MSEQPVSEQPVSDEPVSDEPVSDPTVSASGLCNLRDVGGILLSGGGVVAPGVLYRGDAPMAGDEPPVLTPWPPSTVIDLRSVGERDQMLPADPWPDGVRVFEVSLLAALDPLTLVRKDDPVPAPELLTRLFGHVLESCPQEVVDIVGLIATAPGPVLVHCSGGKDRTALIVALILDVLGADTEALMADHLLSNGRIPVLEKRVERALGRPLAAPLSLVDEVSLRSALDTWRSHPGGAAGWLVEHGLPEEHIAALRERLVAAD